MLSVSSRIWTGVAVSISYKDNNYSTGTSYQRYLMVFHKNLSDNMSPQVSRTLLSIQADLQTTCSQGRI